MTLSWQDSHALFMSRKSHFEMMTDPSRKDGSAEMQRLASIGSQSYELFGTIWELKLRSIPCRTMDLNPGL